MKRSRGFTLIELMIAVAIVAILAAIAIPSYTEYVRRGRVTEAFAALSGMRVKMEQYFQDNRTYADACRPRHDRAAAEHRELHLRVRRPGAHAPTPSRRRDSAGSTLAGFQYSLDQSNTRTTVMAAPSTWPSNAACWVVKRDGSC